MYVIELSEVSGRVCLCGSFFIQLSQGKTKRFELRRKPS